MGESSLVWLASNLKRWHTFVASEMPATRSRAGTLNAVPSDQELLASLQRGEPDAFRLLYDRYARLVYRYIFLRVNQPQDAEDLTAETFVHAWRAIASFQWHEIHLGAWLLRIAHNLVIDRSRRKRELVDWLPWRHGQEDSAFARIEQRDELSRAFESLNNEQQIILYLHFFEGYSLDEIAQFMGKTPNAVTVAKFRGLERLRKVLRIPEKKHADQTVGD